MKKLLPLLCALLCALPTFAQEKEAPKEFGFNFNFEYSDKTRVISAHVGYQREIAGAQPVVFDETVAGKNGVIESEKLSFINEAGAVLGTLTSSFDEKGHLKGQSLVEGAKPPRALDWFVAGTKSPLLTLQDSALTASYTLRDGLLQQRVLNVKTPSGASEIATTYDALGRRERDSISNTRSKNQFLYVYDQDGLTSLRGDSGPNDKPFELTLTRNKDGQMAQLAAKTDGILTYRATPFYDEAGKGTGTKMENFEKGVLTNLMLIKDKSVIKESYRDGVLASRNTLIVGEGQAVQVVSLEEFDASGKLAKRTDYNADGTASAVTTFNADGSVKSTKKFEAGQ